MLRISTLYLFTSLVSIIRSQPVFSQEPAVNYGEKIKIHSTYLNDSVDTYIYLPVDYNKSDTKYPVIYLLDGNYYYPIVSQAVKILAEAGSIPPCIVVGVGSKNRERDFTTAQRKDFNPPMVMPDAGGIDNFLSFLQKELSVSIERKYRTADYQIIIGHSLGGIVAMYSLYKTPFFYKAHILVDASLWWNDGEVGKNAISYLSNNPTYKGKLIWVRDKIPHEAWFDINTEMHAYFTKHKHAGLEFSFTELEDETHSTVIYPGAYMGIKKIFEGYQFRFLQTTDIKTFQAYYDSLAKKLGYPILPSENSYNTLLNILDHEQGNSIALQAALLWSRAYPKSAWAHEMTGDYFWKNGNKEKALEHLNKSLQLEPGRKKAISVLEKIR